MMEIDLRLKRPLTNGLQQNPFENSLLGHPFVKYPDEDLTFSTTCKEKERVMLKNYFFANLGHILIVISSRVHP